MTDATEIIATELARAARPCVTSSFQAECMVLLHLLREVQPDIPVLFIDTFHHFPATYAYRDQLVRDWKLNIVPVQAVDPAAGLWRSSTEACCARHRVGPLFATLERYDTWFTALRREQSPTRAELAEVAPFQLASGRALRKVSPLAAWTWRDVMAYAHVHEIPLMPLYADGYPSIGCEPCTHRPVDPTNPRSGRWGGQKLECGIHIQPRSAEPAERGPSGSAT